MKEKLTIENGKDVTKSIQKGLVKVFLGLDWKTEKKAKQYADDNKTYYDYLFKHGNQVGFVVLK